MKILTLQKRAVLMGLIFYILSIAYALIDPIDKYEQLNLLIEKLAAPQFGEFTTWIAGSIAALSLLLYFIFYFLAYKNSKNAINVFVVASICAFIVLISNLGPQISSGVSDIITTLNCIIDGIIIGLLLLEKSDNA